MSDGPLPRYRSLVSDGLLESGRKMLEQEGLLQFSPHLVHASDFSYAGLEDVNFTHVLIWGVFTDVPPGLVEAALRGLPRVLTKETVALATFGMSTEHRADYRHIRFMQPFTFYERIAAETGLEVELVQGFSHRHPKGHSLLKIRLAGPCRSSLAG